MSLGSQGKRGTTEFFSSAEFTMDHGANDAAEPGSTINEQKHTYTRILIKYCYYYSIEEVMYIQGDKAME